MMLLSVLSVVVLASTATGQVPWWQDSVLYQIYPRSFADSDADGNGDIRGILEHVDYLADLGVGGVWLSPIFMSPWQDNGYDISDFKQIHPTYGTVQDVKDLIQALHKRGILFLLDLVPNHSSDKHRWFQESKTGQGEYKDFYVWKDPIGRDSNGNPIPPNNWRSEISYRESAWEFVPERQQFYLRQFGKFQPDFNFTNPKVVETIKDIMRFWFDLGVDGFRVDSIPFLVEDPLWRDEPVKNGCDLERVGRPCLMHIYTENQQGSYDVVKELDAMIQKEYKDKYLYLEAYASRDETMKYYQKLSAPFNFFFLRNVSIETNANALRSMVDAYMDSLPQDTRYANWVMGNHDNSRVGTRFGLEAVDMMNTLIMLLPGVAFSYQGEEVGMSDADLRDDQMADPLKRERQRTPMQWRDSLNAGFSLAKKTWIPVNPNYWKVNVEKGLKDPNSHLSHYKWLVQYRKHFTGSNDLKTTNYGDWIFAFQRKGTTKNCYVIINLNNISERVVLSAMFTELPSSVKVVMSSTNSQFKTDDTLSTRETLFLRPRSSIVLEEYSKK